MRALRPAMHGNECVNYQARGGASIDAPFLFFNYANNIVIYGKMLAHELKCLHKFL